MINYVDGTNPVIDLEAQLVNPGEIPAVKAIIKVTTPDKDRVLFESTQDIAVNPGEEAIIPISFTLPEIRTNELGIFHTLYNCWMRTANRCSGRTKASRPFCRV